MKKIFGSGSKSEPTTPGSGNTPNRSRASSRNRDDQYLEDNLNIENPGVGDFVTGATALPQDPVSHPSANFLQGMKDPAFSTETPIPSAPVLTPATPAANPMLAPIPPILASTLPVLTPRPSSTGLTAPGRVLTAPVPSPFHNQSQQGLGQAGTDKEQEAEKVKLRQVLELTDHLQGTNIDGNKVARMLTEVCSSLIKGDLEKLEADISARSQMDCMLEAETRNRMIPDLENRWEAHKNKPWVPFHEDRALIPSPQNLAENGTQRPSLERFWKFDRIFKNIGTFNDDGVISIREFLNGMSSVANSFPPAVNMTREEYFQLLWGKLGPTVQGELMDQLNVFSEDPERLHEALLLNYDISEKGEDAMAKLAALRPTSELGTVNKLLREAKRLRQLTDATEGEQVRSFITSLKSFLSYRLKKKFEDMMMEFKSRTGRRLPDWAFLSSFAASHRDEIEENINKVLKRPAARQTQPVPKTNNKKRAVNQVVPPPVVVTQFHPPVIPPPQIQQVIPPINRQQPAQPPLMGIPQQNSYNAPQQMTAIADINAAAFKTMYCDHCNKAGHDRSTCFRLMKCTDCNQVGHTSDRCRTYCRLCGYRSHSSVNCRLYSGQVPMTDPCKYCQQKFGAVLFHSEQSCRLRKAEKNE